MNTSSIDLPEKTQSFTEELHYSSTEDRIFSLLKNYYSSLTEKISEHSLKDRLRNNVIRYEIGASLLMIAVKAKDKKNSLQFLEMLKKGRNSSFLWDEYPYGFKDEAIGFSGMVPTSFALLACIKAYKVWPDSNLLQFILQTSDTIYSLENDGYIPKAKINKGNVLNTNLLAAIAIKETAELLDSSSNRKKLYDELVKRVIRKILGYQSLSGKFPYHFDTARSPILYQAMVSAELRLLLCHFDEPILQKSLHQALNKLKACFDNDGNILWERADSHDKKGSIWAYSFSLSALDNKEPLFESILHKLENSQKNGMFPTTDIEKNKDTFYSAWVSFGLLWCLQKEELEESISFYTLLKWGFLKFEYFTRYLKFCWRYACNKIYGFSFNIGALENRSWRKR